MTDVLTIMWDERIDGFRYHINRYTATKEEVQQHFDLILDVGIVVYDDCVKKKRGEK